MSLLTFTIGVEILIWVGAVTYNVLLLIVDELMVLTTIVSPDIFKKAMFVAVS